MAEEQSKEIVREVDSRRLAISASVRVIPHFPKPGIMFNDITTMLLCPGAFQAAIDLFVERYHCMHVSAIAGEVISERYELEYGTDCLEMCVGAVQPGERVVIMDDLVATGGTLSAAILLVERAGADVIECACVIGLPKFKVSTVQGKPVFILIDPVS
ncbi:adenine phosphoribosyltransferase 2-like isoform X2 [Carex rostrata]